MIPALKQVIYLKKFLDYLFEAENVLKQYNKKFHRVVRNNAKKSCVWERKEQRQRRM